MSGVSRPPADDPATGIFRVTVQEKRPRCIPDGAPTPRRISDPTRGREEELEVQEEVLINSFLVMITVLLLISTAFEQAQHTAFRLAEGTSTEAVLEALTREITSLGS